MKEKAVTLGDRVVTFYMSEDSRQERKLFIIPKLTRKIYNLEYNLEMSFLWLFRIRLQTAYQSCFFQLLCFWLVLKIGQWFTSTNLVIETLISGRTVSNLGSWRISDQEGGREVKGSKRCWGHPLKDLLKFQYRWTLTSINLIQSEEETQFLNHYRWKCELPSGTMSALKV